MRTAQDTEIIITDYNAGSNQYHLAVIQQSIFKVEDEAAEGEEEAQWPNKFQVFSATWF